MFHSPVWNAKITIALMIPRIQDSNARYVLTIATNAIRMGIRLSRYVIRYNSSFKYYEKAKSVYNQSFASSPITA